MIEFTAVKARFEALKRVFHDQGDLFDATESLHPENKNPWVRYTLLMDQFGAMIQYYQGQTLDMDIVHYVRDEGTSMGGVMETLDDVDQTIHEFIGIIQSLMDMPVTICNLAARMWS